MNNLQLDAEIISDFQGTINGHIITDGNLYDNLVIIQVKCKKVNSPSKDARVNSCVIFYKKIRK